MKLLNQISAMIFLISSLNVSASSWVDDHAEKINQREASIEYCTSTFKTLLNGTSNAPRQSPPDSLLSFNPAWDTLFEKKGVNGCFVLLDKRRGVMMTNDWFAAQTQKTPASTFKILNSLIALESSAIPDENYTLKWDGVERQFPNWNRDHDLRSAYKYSVVWYYQEMARRVGVDTMKYWLDKVSYGNADTAGGEDQFWLTGNLRISPIEQIQFLQKLETGQLPFSKHTLNTVKNIMIQDSSSKYVIRWKTGWGNQDGEDIGWIVGYMEVGADVYYFANLIRAQVGKTISQEDFLDARMEILQTILQEYK
jgi:beta-lactamase class D